MKLNAQFDAIIVKQKDTNEKKYGSIVVPDLGKESCVEGEIISVGPGSYTVTGEFIPITLKIGQKVILPQAGPVKFDFEGESYLICSEKTVFAVIEE
jgi:chaperonin GroES